VSAPVALSAAEREIIIAALKDRVARCEARGEAETANAAYQLLDKLQTLWRDHE
jgi:hypothetical protein